MRLYRDVVGDDKFKGLAQCLSCSTAQQIGLISGVQRREEKGGVEAQGRAVL